MIRRWDKSRPPQGPFALNRDCPQARGLVAWYPTVGQKYIANRATTAAMHLAGTNSGASVATDGAPSVQFNGSSNELSAALSVLTGPPVSLHVFASSTSISTTQGILGIGNSGTGYRELASLLFVGSKAWALTQDGSGSNVQAIGATTLSSNVQYGIGGIWQSTTSRRVYLNGAADAAEETSSRDPVGLNQIVMGRRANGSDYQYLTGSVAEACVWGIAVDEFVFRRINDPGTRFELWYPLRSRKWFAQVPGGYTHPILSNARMGSLTTTGGVPLVDYTF